MRFRLPEIPPPKLISALRFYDLLPAIIFVPSRRRCDEAATEVAFDKSQKVDKENQFARQEIFEEFLAVNPEIKTHKHRKILLRSGVASHHAGHIPAWKFLIEKMMSKGLINALFATSTVAAGVDFPARSVVVLNADTRGNDGWRPLGASELQQMTGRAGRRGKDNVGFVVLAPSNFQNPPRIAKLLNSPPDPLESKFRATYSSLLNLLDGFGSFEQVRGIAEKSFAFRKVAGRIADLEKEIERRTKVIGEMLETKAPGLSLDDVIGFERLTSAQMRLQENLPTARAEIRRVWLKENVKSGRIISRGKGGKRFLLVMSVYGDKVSAINDDGYGVDLSLLQIKKVYSKRYPVNEKSIDVAFYDIFEGKNPALNEPKVKLVNENLNDTIKLIEDIIERLMPDDLKESSIKIAQKLLWETWKDAEFIQKANRDIEALRNEIWYPFENRARVLDHFDYLDFDLQLVSDDGKWLADLRIDKPLLVGEVLKAGIFEKMEIGQAAGLIAALTADSDRDYGKLYLSEKLMNVLKKIEDIVYVVSKKELNFGVEPQNEINFSAAAAAESWTNGMIWSDLVWETGAEEGDLVRLLSRTGEALIQIANLKVSKPDAAKKARIISEIILREPIR